VLKKIRKQASGLKQAQPGERFRKLHARRSGKTRSTLVDVLQITVAVILILSGIVLSLVPGVPGIVLALPGLALLAFRFRSFAAFLDQAEVMGRKMIQPIVKRFKKN
jgi:hypothetical protein